MATYQIKFFVAATKTIEIEAKNVDKAIKMAINGYGREIDHHFDKLTVDHIQTVWKMDECGVMENIKAE